jgi:hypothetical protein
MQFGSQEWFCNQNMSRAFTTMEPFTQNIAYEESGKLVIKSALLVTQWCENTRCRRDTHLRHKRPPSLDHPRVNGTHQYRKDMFSRKHCTFCKNRRSDRPSMLLDILTFRAPRQRTRATVPLHIRLRKSPLESFCYLQRLLAERKTMSDNTLILLESI